MVEPRGECTPAGWTTKAGEDAGGLPAVLCGAWREEAVRDESGPAHSSNIPDVRLASNEKFFESYRDNRLWRGRSPSTRRTWGGSRNGRAGTDPVFAELRTELNRKRGGAAARLSRPDRGAQRRSVPGTQAGSLGDDARRVSSSRRRAGLMIYALFRDGRRVARVAGGAADGIYLDATTASRTHGLIAARLKSGFVIANDRDRSRSRWRGGIRRRRRTHPVSPGTFGTLAETVRAEGVKKVTACWPTWREPVSVDRARTRFSFLSTAVGYANGSDPGPDGGGFGQLHSREGTRRSDLSMGERRGARKLAEQSSAHGPYGAHCIWPM